MKWYHYLSCFSGGGFLANTIPHLVRRHGPPFSKPFHFPAWGKTVQQALYLETKKLSVDLHKKDFQTIVREAVELHLPFLRKKVEKNQKSFQLKPYDLGGHKRLSRKKIYEG